MKAIYSVQYCRGTPENHKFVAATEHKTLDQAMRQLSVVLENCMFETSFIRLVAYFSNRTDLLVNAYTTGDYTRG
jgi:hypothetical protein